MSELAFRAAVPAILVALATMAGRRWGDVATGLVGGLPVVAGPILFFYAREQGPVFAAEAAELTLLSIVSLSFFLLTFGWRSWFKASALSCLLLGWFAFAVCTVLMDHITAVHVMGLAKALGYALLTLFLARRSLPQGGVTVDPPKAAGGAEAFSRWDLPLRVAFAALLVVILTGLAHRIGPRLGGLLTAFPIASTVLTLFAYSQGGREAALAVIKGLLVALNAYAAFCVVLALVLPAWNLYLSFTAAVLATVVIQTLLLKFGPVRVRASSELGSPIS
ncbi:MAG: hypothetical protein ACREKE_10045 [bacterium]